MPTARTLAASLACQTKPAFGRITGSRRAPLLREAGHERVFLLPATGGMPSIVSKPRLVGRDEELGKVRAFLDTRHELPRALLLEGEAGIGKTALWLTALEQAAALGYLVLSSRPSEAEAGFSFAGLADLFGGVVSDVMAELPRPQRRSLEAALGLSEPDPGVGEGVLAFAVLSALRQLAGRSPIVLAVDDVQWLDAPSLALFRYALARFESEPVAVLVTVRGDVPDWIRRAVSEQRLLSIELGPLSLGAIYELLRRHLEMALPRPVLLRIWATSGGNPFFALELARALERRGGRIEPGEELPLPPTLEKLVHERLDGLSAAALEVARVAAALAEPVVSLVELAVVRAADRGLAEALATGVLELDGERLRFSHPLLRSAVSARSSPAERRSLHKRLARLVPDAEERAQHLALAARGPSREAASALEEAAYAAHARGAAAAGAELAEQALRLTPASDAEQRRLRAVHAADRLLEAGDSRGAIRLLEQARTAAPPGRAHAAVLVSLAQPTWKLEGPRAALALCLRALVEADGDDALQAKAHLLVADLMRFAEGASIDRGLEHAERAVAAAGRAGDPALRCKALAQLALLRFLSARAFPHGEMKEALALERSLEGPPLIGATWTIGYLLAWSGEDLERARRHLHEYRDRVRVRDDPEEGNPLWWLTLVELRAGNWGLAARYAAELFALTAQTEDVGSRPVMEFAPAAIAAYQGRIEEARTRAGHALRRAEELGIPVARSMHLWVLGFVELSLGNSKAALEHLRSAWHLRDELGYFEPGHRLELGDTLEALIAAGELDEAELLLRPWADRCRALDRAWAIAIIGRCRALLSAARGDFAGAFAAFDDAIAEHGRCVYPFEHARTLLALGMTQRRAKRRTAARATLEQALGIFEELGAPLWSEKARAELARIGGRRPRGGELTPTERRLAELVAEGRSNKEIAASLFVTPKTVGTTLSRLYAKLGVHSRTELIRRLAERPASKV